MPREELLLAAAEGAASYNYLRDQLNAGGVQRRANDSIHAGLSALNGPDTVPYYVDKIETDTAEAIGRLLTALQIDTGNDHNTKETAARVAKMYVREVMRGRYEPKPDITAFPNALNLDELYVTGPITVRSMCSHHLVPIIGKCWIGVVPGEDSVIGLSKFNRLADWVFARPQIQEEASIQLADIIEQECKPKGLAIVVKATHMCMTWRGVRESMEAAMTTSVMRGCLRTDASARAEFLALAGVK